MIPLLAVTTNPDLNIGSTFDDIGSFGFQLGITRVMKPPESMGFQFTKLTFKVVSCPTIWLYGIKLELMSVNAVATNENPEAASSMAPVEVRLENINPEVAVVLGGLMIDEIPT